MGDDVVVAVDRKRPHSRSARCHALRGDHIHHSEELEKQGDSVVSRRWRRAGTGVGLRPELAGAGNYWQHAAQALGRKQEEAIAALLIQRNVEEAARAAGIGARTLLRWLKVPEFQTAYRDARREACGQSIARLQQGTAAAATTLLKLLVEPGTPASVRARVADSIFNHAAKAIEIEDIEARVAALERAAEATRQGR
jgi:hypothetical protein